MLSHITSEELSTTLDRLAGEVLEEAGIYEPPVDALALSQSLGIQVAWDDQQTSRARFVRLQTGRGHAPHATILLRPEPRLERRHWATAHEIGEHLAYRVFHELSIDPREAAPQAREKVANYLAGRLLVPGNWFGLDGPSLGWDLLALKTRYSTASHELLARRMLDMTPAVIVSIFDEGRPYFRQSNVPGRVPPPTPVELRCWQLAHHTGQPEFAEGGTSPVQAWPIHEETWKREILRTEIDTFDCPP